jgi:hypothetical protein
MKQNESNIKKFIHLIYIPFTGLGINEYKGDSWFKYRIGLFKRYTLQSLKAQSCQDFTLWISFRKEEKENPLTTELEQAIKESGVKYIFTYDGIMMHDDRGTFHNTDLQERMQTSLNTLQGILEPSEWVFKTDLGSDDLFHFEAIRELQQQPPRERGACYYLGGYIYDMENDRLADWNRETSCSKYTIMYPSETFYDAKKHLEYISGLVSHEYIPQVFKAVRLPDWRYMCGVHKGNISTNWENKMRGNQYGDPYKENILKNFGVNE